MKKTILLSIFLITTLFATSQPIFHLRDIKPVITCFCVPDSSFSLTVPINKFIAHDDSKVIGYKITESTTTPTYSSSGWSKVPIESYTFKSKGLKTIYAWAKDDSRYVSLSSHGHIIVIDAPTPPTPPVPPAADTTKYPTDYPGTEYYISPTGNDAASGTSESSAWKSIPNGKTFKSSDAVLFKSDGAWVGTITIPCSGITVGAYGLKSSRPKIYGSEIITGWTLHSGNIYKATFTNAINQLFVDNVRMQTARFPSTGFANVDIAKSTSAITCNALNTSINYTGAVCIINSISYGIDKRTVTSSSGSTVQLNAVPFGDVSSNEKFILVGKLEFLTKAGQWYYDTATKTVYLWTPNNDSPDKYEVRGSVYDNGIYVSQKSSFTIENIEFLHQKTDAIYLSGCTNFSVKNNSVKFNDAIGISDLNCSGGNYSNNYVEGSNHLGIRTEGGTNSIIKSNEVRNIALFDNLGLSSIGAWYNGNGIATNGNGNTVSYNRIDEVGYNGISFNKINIIEYNYITNICRTKNDGAAIYTSALPSYQSESNKGSVIRYNICLYGWGYGADPYGEGIYLDESSGGVLVEYNTVGFMSVRGIFPHLGNSHIIRNNTVFACGNGIYLSGDGRNISITNNIVYGLSGQEMIHLNVLTGTPVINYNTYISPYMSNPFELNWTNHYTFINWKSKTGHDGSSTFNNTALPTGYSEMLITNPTNATTIFNLNGATSVKNAVTGASLTGSFSVAAYSSVIVTGVNLVNIK